MNLIALDLDTVKMLNLTLYFPAYILLGNILLDSDTASPDSSASALNKAVNQLSNTKECVGINILAINSEIKSV